MIKIPTYFKFTDTSIDVISINIYVNKKIIEII